MREFRGKAAIVIAILYVAFVGWSLIGAVRPIETFIFRMAHLAFIFVLGFLAFPVSPKAPGWTKWLDGALAVVGFATPHTPEVEKKKKKPSQNTECENGASPLE
jgi:TRAP-type uncharacterized transport system fused permease subunit